MIASCRLIHFSQAFGGLPVWLKCCQFERYTRKAGPCGGSLGCWPSIARRWPQRRRHQTIQDQPKRLPGPTAAMTVQNWPKRPPGHAVFASRFASRLFGSSSIASRPSESSRTYFYCSRFFFSRKPRGLRGYVVCSDRSGRVGFVPIGVVARGRCVWDHRTGMRNATTR